MVDVLRGAQEIRLWQGVFRRLSRSCLRRGTAACYRRWPCVWAAQKQIYPQPDSVWRFIAYEPEIHHDGWSLAVAQLIHMAYVSCKRLRLWKSILADQELLEAVISKESRVLAEKQRIATAPRWSPTTKKRLTAEFALSAQMMSRNGSVLANTILCLETATSSWGYNAGLYSIVQQVPLLLCIRCSAKTSLLRANVSP